MVTFVRLRLWREIIIYEIEILLSIIAESITSLMVEMRRSINKKTITFVLGRKRDP